MGRRGERVYAREHVNLLILLVQQVLQISDFSFQSSHAFLQRFGIATRKGPAAQLVTRSTLKTNIGALCAARANAVTSDLFASTSITSLGNPALSTGATDLDHFHGQDTRHVR